MSAHDPSGSDPVHLKTRPSGRPALMDVDKSGVSMSWKTATSIGGVLVAGAVAWTVFTAGLSTKEDLASHNVATASHPIVLEEGEPAVPMPALVKKHAQEQIRIVAVVKTNTEAMDEVRDGQHEQRAESVAYRAIDKLPPRTTPRRRIETFQRVKRQAKSNLESKRDIRDGIELGY